MNILFFYPSGFEPKYGGTEKVMDTLSRYFTRDGHSIFYAAIHRATDYHPPYPYLVLDDHKFSTFSSVRVKLLADFVRDNKIDLIIDNYHHNKLKYLKMISNVKKTTGVKVITLYHTAPTGHELRWIRMSEKCSINVPRKKRLKERLIGKNKIAKLEHFQTAKSLRFRLDHFDKVVLLSKQFIPEAIALSGERNAEKYTAIPNTIGTIDSLPTLGEKKNQLLWVGRMAPLKRPEKALKIWIDIQDKFPDWEIIFLGNAEMYEALKATAEKIAKRCHFLGFQKPDTYYHDAKIFLMTSDFEGLPLVLVEAQRYGVVPIAFDNFASVRDIIIEGKTGFLVPTNDINTYKEKLCALMSDCQRTKEMSENAQQHSLNFAEENVIPQWYRLFESLGL